MARDQRPRTDGMAEVRDGRPARWPPLAMAFHWVIAALVAVMLATGFAMTYRGDTLGVWDGLTNALYTAHKTTGFLILWLALARIARRLVGRVPPPPALPRWQLGVAGANHLLLYALLVAMPLLGWTAVSLFPALDLFGGLALPALTAPDAAEGKPTYEAVAGWHRTGAFVLLALVALHVAAALHHLLVRRDGVFGRMWPGSR